MDFATAFRDFGYPAMVTGVILWMYITRFEALSAKIDDLSKKVNDLCREVKELRSDVKEKERKL